MSLEAARITLCWMQSKHCWLQEHAKRGIQYRSNKIILSGNSAWERDEVALSATYSNNGAMKA